MSVKRAIVQATRADVMAHIDRYNPHTESRDAWQGIGLGFSELAWVRTSVPLADIGELYPASKRDVKAYARAIARGSPPPAVVLERTNGAYAVLDGAHRISAARLAGMREIDAFVGTRQVPSATRANPAHNHADIGLARAVENGHVFETGVPVAFPFIHNTESAPKLLRGAVDRYQQRLEPAGRYLLHDTDMTRTGPLARGWVGGIARASSPLVVHWNTDDGGYDERSWKARLAAHYRRTGVALTRALVRDGYDAVITVNARGETAEIVDLSVVR